jgi:hypothetical protein
VELQPIETPELLDPDRIVDPNRGNMTIDHESAAKELREALEATAEYGQQLWHHLVAVRQYLMESLPPDPRAAGPHTQLSAHPSGPDDTEGWQRWADIYASVVAVLAGPHGDHGYGHGEAREAVRIRTQAPNARLAARLHDTLGPGTSGPPATEGEPAERTTGNLDSAGVLRGLALAALGLLAVRGLRPRS